MQTREDFVWKMGGQQGEGIESGGEILAKVLAALGYSLFSQRLFASRIKGGHTTFALRIASHQLGTIGEGVDNLIALDQETIDQHGHELRSGGVLIADTKFAPKGDSLPAGVTLLALPITDTAKECGSLQMKNIVALGMSVAYLGFPRERFIAAISDRFAKKTQEVIAANVRAFNEGARLVDEQKDNFAAPGTLPEPPDADLLFLMGNEAIALGALAAGARFMASYPITPASEIMEYMIQAIDRVHGAVVQTEDELASCMMAIGANFAGVRAFTATSGPGLSLMAESISLATIAEIPMVIIDVMRAGPSTGMATKVEQSDIMAAIYSAHGDVGKIVVAPTSTEECFYVTAEAFNLAEQYQCPVIVLADLQQGLNKQSVPALDLSRVKIERGNLQTKDLPELTRPDYFARFADTESGISPRTIPGTPNGMFLSTGLEHDTVGKPAEAPSNRVVQTDKRLRKFTTVADHFAPLAVDAPTEEADVLLISINSACGAAAEAAEHLRKEGIKVNRIGLRLLEPFRTEALRPYVEKAKKVLVLEQNATGQLTQLLTMHLPELAPFSMLKRYDGLTLTPSQIVARVKEVL
ncbi:MAG: 2-oxoacid:acceptor oxidoreductase subunit alpha [Negativicoccus succinicivorans]|uniref:2-oxoacid:acceptor oxidoreductase subunit alpha n=1 Tax=Negativicoccus succinicivorans TaxID=620903 RepID=UPI00290CD8E3|nr:2-oxoacid:acceptor oxidoreductase subunit alpha [Negativicoccus succinicivorans]MDU5943191.1 2-oxoacid:acceptor oxidoreductase subunit alpha [Negativicoccus succinicivorans]